MGSHQPYSRLAAMLVLAWMVIILLSSPGACAGNVSIVTTGVEDMGSANYRFVLLKMDLGREEHLKAFPRRIGGWAGVEEDTGGLEESLGADAYLLRTYRTGELSQPVFLLLMQTSRKLALHSLASCYAYMGYKIEESVEDIVHVADASWAQGVTEQDLKRLPASVSEALRSSPQSGWLPVKKLVVFKERNGRVTERWVVIYFFTADRVATSNKLNLVRASALVPASGPYGDTLASVKDLVGQAVPLMFQPAGEDRPFITRLVERGPSGHLAILLLLAIPLTVLFHGRNGCRKDPRDT